MEGLSTIATFLITLALNTAGGEALKFSFVNIRNKLTKPELKKHGDSFNSIFVSAFQSTIKKFSSGDLSFFNLPPKIIDELSSMDAIQVSIIFGNPDIAEYSSLNEENVFKKITEKLKYFLENNNYKLDEQFYSTWETIFQQEYHRVFRLFFHNDKNAHDDTLLSFFELTTDELSTIKKYLESNSDDMRDVKEAVFEIRDILQDKLALPLQHRYAESLETIEDKDIQKIQTLIDDYKFDDCLTFINLCLHDEWSSRSSEFKAQIYNKKGYCLACQYKNEEAIEAYKFALELNPDYSTPIVNLCNEYLTDKDEVNFNKYFEKFKDKESAEFKKIEFYKLLVLDKKPDEALAYLEVNKELFDDYLYLKAKVSIIEVASHDTIIRELEEYIETQKPKSSASKFDLLQTKFAQLFEKHPPRYLFSISDGGIVKIAIENASPYTDEDIMELENSLEETLQLILKRNPYNLNYINSLKILIILAKFMQNKLEQNNSYITDVLADLNSIANDYYMNLAFIIALLKNDFEKAYEAYNLLSDSTKQLNLEQFVTVVVALGKYEEALKIAETIDSVPKDGFEQLKIISMHKVQGWDTTYKYIKENLHQYSIGIKRICAELMYENEELSESLNLYKEFAQHLIESPENGTCDFVYQLSHRLQFFQSQDGIKTLEEQLIETYWNENQTEENFDVGIVYAVDLYNRGKYAKCLSVLGVLDKFNPEHQKIKELYAYIDLINYNTENIIKSYESGHKPDYLLPHVAYAYIHSNQLDKAEKVIENLKYRNKLSDYYYYKAHLNIVKNNYDEAALILKKGSDKCPDDLRIHQTAFSLLIHGSQKLSSSKDHYDLFHKSKDVMSANKLLFEFQVNENSVQEDFKNVIESIEPEANHNKRMELYTNAINNYENYSYPIEVLSFVLKKDIATVFTDRLLNPNAVINLSAGTSPIFEQELVALSKNKNVLLDICSLILIKELGLEEIFKKEFNLKISVYTAELIKKMLASEPIEAVSDRLIKNKNGDMELISAANPLYNYKDYLKECLDAYKPLGFNSSSKKGIPLVEASEKIGIKDIFYNGTIGIQFNTLVCADTIMSQLYTEFGVSCVSLVTMLEFLYEKKKILDELYLNLKLKLVELKCRYIPISSKVLFDALLKNVESYELLINSFDKFIDIESLSKVLSYFVYMLNKNEEQIRDKKYKALEIMFNKVRTLSPNGELFKLLTIELHYYYLTFNDLLQKYLSNKFYEFFKEDFTAFYTSSIKQYIREKKEFSEAEYNNFYLRLANNAPIKLRNEIITFAEEHKPKIQTQVAEN